MASKERKTPYDILLSFIQGEGGYAACKPTDIKIEEDGRQIELSIRAVVLKFEYCYWDADNIRDINYCNLCMIDSNMECWDIADYCTDKDVAKITKSVINY